MGSVERIPTRSAPLDLLLHRDAAIDVWLVDLDSPDWRDPRRPAGLSDDEKRRAEAFRFDQDCRRFVACRSAVRMILGRYLDSDPLDIRFRYGPYGKPRLERNGLSAPLHFNVSHSEHLALVAVSRESEVGVDIEHVRARPGIPDIIERQFAPAERRALLRAPEGEHLSRFYRYWTLKEAHLKAAGLGMNHALAAILQIHELEKLRGGGLRSVAHAQRCSAYTSPAPDFGRPGGDGFDWPVLVRAAPLGLIKTVNPPASSLMAMVPVSPLKSEMILIVTGPVAPARLIASKIPPVLVSDG